MRKVYLFISLILMSQPLSALTLTLEFKGKILAPMCGNSTMQQYSHSDKNCVPIQSNDFLVIKNSQAMTGVNEKVIQIITYM